MKNLSSSLLKADKTALLFVAWMWSFSLWPYVLSVVRRMPVLVFFTDYIIQVISIVLALLAILNNKNKVIGRDIVFYLVIVLIYYFHMVLFPSNYEYLQTLKQFFFYSCLPYYFVGLFINIDKQQTVLEYVSILVILLILVYRYLFRVQVGDDLMASDMEDMAEAYRLLPHFLLLLFSVLQKFNIWKTLVVILTFIIISGTGNRGSLLMIVLLITLYFLLIKQYKLPILTRLFVVVIVLIAVYYLPDFARFMSESLLGLDMGFNDRAYQIFLEGEIAWDNGRDDIRGALYSKLVESPLWGWGLCGDRVFIKTYAHNLLVELIFSFGYLFGSALLLCVVLVVVRGYFKCNTVNEKGLLIILFLLGFAVLFISSSFLENRFFWLLIGYSIYLKRNYFNNEKNTISLRCNKHNDVVLGL